MMRAALLLCGAVLAALFFLALVESAPPARVHVAVLGEAVVATHAQPYVVRLSAVDVAAQRSAPVSGIAQIGAARAPIVDTIARVPFDERADALELFLDVGGRRTLALRCPLRVDAARPSEDLWERAPAVRPMVTGVRERAVALALDHGAAHVAIDTPHHELLAVELLVDGALRDAHVLEVDRHAQLDFALSADLRPDALVVVHAAEPWPLARGAYAAGIRGQGAVAPPGMRPALLRPAPLACNEKLPAHPHLWRAAFEVAAALFVFALVCGLLVRSRAEARRGALLAVVSGAVLAAGLAGLDVILRLGALGSP